MSISNRICSLSGEERGVVLPLVAIGLVTILAAVALTVDVGREINVNRELQLGSDAAALAAVNLLTTGTRTDGDILLEAQSIAGSNGISAAELTTVECGAWDDASSAFTSCTVSGCDCTNGSVNAVRVVADRTFGSTFSSVVGIQTQQTDVESIALSLVGGAVNCIKPFGIEIDAIQGLVAGDVLSVGKNSPGNWGKLDIGGMMSSGTNFHDAMLEEVCHSEVEIGQTVSQGTGFGGSLSNVFADMVAAGKHLNMIIAINDEFRNGNSDTTIEQFCKVDYLSDNNRNGSNWVGTFRIVECPTTPPQGPGGSPLGRVLVK